MTYQSSDSLRYYTFDIFQSLPVTQGVFTRRGGVSPAPWNSLNQGGTVGDTRANVIENRKRIFNAIERPVESIFDVWQVHSADVICTDIPRPLDAQHAQADAIVTDRADITLFMRFADCVPILLYDPKKKVVGLVHAGWQGTVKKVVQATIQAMADHYGSRAGDILAGIGPSIGPDHYEVKDDLISRVRNSFKDHCDELLQRRDGKTCFDLWNANRISLEEIGVKQIQIAGVCTACHLEDWYSHRAEMGKTGRFSAVIALNS
jgi:YfiH family protein